MVSSGSGSDFFLPDTVEDLSIFEVIEGSGMPEGDKTENVPDGVTPTTKCVSSARNSRGSSRRCGLRVESVITLQQRLPLYISHPFHGIPDIGNLYSI